MNAVNPFTVTTTSFGTVSCCRRDVDGTVSYEIHAVLNFGVAQRNPKFFGEYVVRGQKKVVDAAKDEYPENAIASMDMTFDTFEDMWGTYRHVQEFFMSVEADIHKKKLRAERAQNTVDEAEEQIGVDRIATALKNDTNQSAA